MSADGDDFRNVVRVPKFHQAPQRIQARYAGGDSDVIILPVVRIERLDARRDSDTAKRIRRKYRVRE